VFEEGNAFTMEAVQQQLDDLAAKHEAQVGSHVKQTLGLVKALLDGIYQARDGRGSKNQIETVLQILT